uniref:Uncharacterized protein n=1 Tax=Kalanchoe fedtschenkoi TaxID=63787 RepID=A0A7N0V4W7_KALFE
MSMFRERGTKTTRSGGIKDETMGGGARSVGSEGGNGGLVEVRRRRSRQPSDLVMVDARLGLMREDV